MIQVELLAGVTQCINVYEHAPPACQLACRSKATGTMNPASPESDDKANCSAVKGAGKAVLHQKLQPRGSAAPRVIGGAECENVTHGVRKNWCLHRECRHCIAISFHRSLSLAAVAFTAPL